MKQADSSQVSEEQTSRHLKTWTKPGGMTIRSVLIGFLAIIPAVFWGVYGDVVSQTDLTSTSLMMPPILILVVLIIVNGLIGRRYPSRKLTQREMITIYAMLTVAVVLSGMGLLQFLCTTLGAVYHYETPQNNWKSFLDHVPAWLLPQPLSSLEGFYKGGESIPWHAWWRPVVIWSGFFFTLLFCMLCINAIVRKQWMDRERLTFPIVFLPLEMTDPKTGFFSNRLMWLGFAIAAGVETMNSLNWLFPTVPHLQIRAYDLAPFFVNKPWNAMGYFPTTFYPLAIGLGFLLSTEVSFSCWFFYVLTKLENVFVSAMGWTGAAGGLSQPPYITQQGTGAFIGIVLVVIWLGRRHFSDVLRKAFHGAPDVDDSNEPLSYRTATFGLAGGFVAMIIFCAVTGLSPVVGAGFLGIYLIFSTTIARMRAEAGPAWTMGPDWDANQTLISPIGSSAFSKQNLVMLAYLNWFAIEMRCDPMPGQIESMKMAQAVKMRQQTMMLVMVLAIVVGVAVGFWACLAVWYEFGAGTAKVEPWRTWMGAVPFTRVEAALNNPRLPDLAGLAAMTFGAGLTIFLSVMRTQFLWFPFHPAGYVLANTGTMYWLWLPFLIAWLAKLILIRYGGIKAYRAALPFFLGLILGDYVISSLWALAGSIFGIQMYRCFPC